MRTRSYEQQTVTEIAEQFHGNEDVLQGRGISASRWSLANAAAATGTTTDELLAVLDYRLRHNARQQQPVARVDEGELVA